MAFVTWLHNLNAKMKLKKQLQHLISMVKISTVTHKLVGLGFDRVLSIGSQFNQFHILQECEVSSLFTEPTHRVQRSIIAFMLKFPKISKPMVLEGLIKCLLTWHSFIGEGSYTK
jgi:predicted protein tyrosine phosphatase